MYILSKIIWRGLLLTITVAVVFNTNNKQRSNWKQDLFLRHRDNLHHLCQYRLFGAQTAASQFTQFIYISPSSAIDPFVVSVSKYIHIVHIASCKSPHRICSTFSTLPCDHCDLKTSLLCVVWLVANVATLCLHQRCITVVVLY